MQLLSNPPIPVLGVLQQDLFYGPLEAALLFLPLPVRLHLLLPVVVPGGPGDLQGTQDDGQGSQPLGQRLAGQVDALARQPKARFRVIRFTSPARGSREA